MYAQRHTPTQNINFNPRRSLTLGLGPLFGASIGRLSGLGALWDYVPRVCSGGGGCAGGGVPLGAVPALSWCGEVSLGVYKS